MLVLHSLHSRFEGKPKSCDLLYLNMSASYCYMQTAMFSFLFFVGGSFFLFAYISNYVALYSSMDDCRA